MTIDFWFEFASTYSYPAAMRIEQRARERGVSLAWNAFLLGPIFRAQGWNDVVLDGLEGSTTLGAHKATP